MSENYDYIVVGCGLSGATIAERLASQCNKKVLIIEKRDHIGGNCYDYIDSETRILLNKYGAHLFHTNNEEVWDYVNQFDTWVKWEHEVLTLADNKYVPIPVNITTINELCNENIKNEKEAQEWLEKVQEKYDNIENSEQMAKSRIGNVLYEKLIKDYTYKQWNKYPEELNKEVLQRIPIRQNFDTRYFSDKYQALPKYGYTHFFKKLLSHPNITVKLNTDFFEYKKQLDKEIKIIYTGPIDSYFANSNYEKLEYRSIDFHIEKVRTWNYILPNSVVNYASKNIPYTRSVEYKHFLNQVSSHSIIVSETTTDTGEPYYPVPNKRNQELYEKYKELAKNETNVIFLGRLANYKYFNMDQAIESALQEFKNLKIDF